MDKEGIKTLMSGISLFKELDNEEVNLLANHMEYKKEAKGSIIINQGEVESTLYYIVSGEVEVCVHTPSASESPLVQRRKGETIGEMALFGLNNVRSASVVAFSVTELLSLSKNNYEQLTEKYPKIALKIQKSVIINLCRRIKELSDEVVYSRLIG